MSKKTTSATLLVELQPRLAELQKIGQIGGWYYVPETQRSWWSPELYRLFGLTPANTGPSYEQFLMRVHPDDRRRVQNSYNRAIQLELELRHEFRVVRPDGVVLWIEGYSQPQRDVDGKVIRYEGTNQDITLRKSHELQASEKSIQLRNTFDTLSEGLQIIDFNYRYQYVNDAAVRHCQQPRNELLGQYIISNARPADDDFTGLALRRCMETREPIVLDCVSNFCGRMPGLFDVTLQPVPEGVLILSSEVSEQQRSEQQLRAKDNELSAFFDSSSVGMCECTFDGKVLRVNDACCRMLGYERDRLLGVKTIDLVHVNERGDAQQMLSQLSQDKQKNYQKLRRFYRYDGSIMHALIYVTVNRREHGKPISFIGVLTDLSEQVKLEEQVRQAEKMQAIGRLAGGVAHDFNNLLTVILGAGNLIAKDPELPQAVKEHAEAIVDAGRRGAELTQQLLTYSRRKTLSKRTLDVNQSIRDSELMLQRIAGADVRLRFRLSADPLLVLIDPVQFQQVIMNLVVNARDAMSHTGEIEIMTTLQTGYPWPTSDHTSSLTGAVEVAISDNGSGIPPDVLKRIYDPFFTTKEVGQGTGLGLSVVHGIIEESGGAIEVDTTVGSGTTMRVLFPVAR